MPLSPEPKTLTDLSVFVAMPCLEDPKLYTTMALLDVQEVCAENGVSVEFAFVTGSLVHHARSLLTHVFLQRKERNRIFWWDSDIKATPTDFCRLLVQSLKEDIVLGVYPRRREPPGYFIEFVRPGDEPNERGLVEIVHTGMGFSCIRRSVMEHMSALAPKLKHSHDGEAFPAVFRQDDDGEAVRGEDYAFWSDVRAQGYKIWADATLQIGHVGTKVYQCSLPAK
jgi:hypothetical protein